LGKASHMARPDVNGVWSILLHRTEGQRGGQLMVWINKNNLLSLLSPSPFEKRTTIVFPGYQTNTCSLFKST
jgi:hypothetical protein